MSKKKKAKVVALKPVQLSAEKYIKTQARLLPIAECIINNEWETAGIANILVARKHKNGNLTIGLFLVDMYCLGLRMCYMNLTWIQKNMMPGKAN